MTQARLPQLDFVRGIAILLVIQFHRALPPEAAGVLSPITTRLYKMGWTGVDLFFVLSGFLIGGLLFKEIGAYGKLDIRRFLVRRAFKIWPSYYLYLAFLGGLFLFTGQPHKEGGSNSLLPNLLHYQNYTIPPRNHTWSLAVEEHFYLLLPLLLGWQCARPNRLRLLPAIAVGVGVACLALRIWVNLRHPWSVSTHLTPTHLRIDSLFFGVLLAYLSHFHHDRIERVSARRATLLIAGLALVLPSAFLGFNGRIMSTIGFSALYVGYGCLLLWTISIPLGVGRAGRLLAGPIGRAVAFIGVYSYPIYLWHIDFGQLPLLALYRQGFLSALPGEMRWLIFTAFYVAAATAAGFAIGKLVEKPALALRDRLFPSRAAIRAGDVEASLGDGTLRA